ncbi:hypothetical protein ACFYU8_18650 [Brevibacillus sp. NPDC003359]|uniref:hypothetical protein n=1 Tax=unclassified Brevibacillus TaxID=2684853 RepID=UPI00368F7EAB
MKTVIAIIENPNHTGWKSNNPIQYKHKFGSRSAIDRYMQQPHTSHLKIVEVRPYNREVDGVLPFTLK